MPYGGNPHTDDKDAVRAMVGDVDTVTALLDDNTYSLIVATETNLYARASMASEALAGKYAKEMNKRIGDFWRDAKVLFQHYADLAKEYRRQSRTRIKASPFVGGDDVADYIKQHDDLSLAQPRFQVGMIDGTQEHAGGDPVQETQE